MIKLTITTVWRWVVKQYDKLESSPGLIRSGQWYVRYNDGTRTHRMTYDVCKDYADIFGGKVVHDRYRSP